MEKGDAAVTQRGWSIFRGEQPGQKVNVDLRLCLCLLLLDLEKSLWITEALGTVVPYDDQIVPAHQAN